jgi:diacylglycerol kinase (ATP)
MTKIAASARVVVVYNPALRTLKSMQNSITSQLAKHVLPKPVWVAAQPGMDDALTAQLPGAVLVLVLGGDGLVRSVAEHLVVTDIPLGIIPMGTGNLLARNLHLPINDAKKALAIALSDEQLAIDVARLMLQHDDQKSTHTFMVMAGIGLDAAMAGEANFEMKKRLGWLAYIAPIVRSVVRNDQHHMVLELDDRKPVPIKAHTAIVGNCGTLTANLLLLPAAELADGKLDVVVLNPKAITGWTRIWSRLAISGALVRSKSGRALLKTAPPISALQYGQFRHLKLTLNSPQPVQIDGDIVGEASTLTVDVLPQALRVRVAPR